MKMGDWNEIKPNNSNNTVILQRKVERKIEIIEGQFHTSLLIVNTKRQRQTSTLNIIIERQPKMSNPNVNYYVIIINLL